MFSDLSLFFQDIENGKLSETKTDNLQTRQ